MDIVVLIVLAVLAVAVVAMYNSLVRRRNRVKQAYSGIQVQLVQRYDLTHLCGSLSQGHATS